MRCQYYRQWRYVQLSLHEHSIAKKPQKHEKPAAPGLGLGPRVGLRLGRLRLGLGKSLFPVGRAKDQRLPARPIATAYNYSNLHVHKVCAN